MKTNQIVTLIILATMGCANNGWSQELTGAGSTSPTTSPSLPPTVGSLNTATNTKFSISEDQKAKIAFLKSDFDEEWIREVGIANANVDAKQPGLNGQCVSYVKNARSDLGGKWNNAIGGATAFSGSNEVNSTPRVGAAFTIPAGTHGHTGLVTEVSLVSQDGQFFYQVSFNDANRGGDGDNPELGSDGGGVVRSGVVMLSYPGAVGDFSFVNRGTDIPRTPNSYSFTFIHETKDVYNQKLKTITDYLKQLFDSGLLKSEKLDGTKIEFSEEYAKKEFLEKFLLFKKADFAKFLDVVSLYKTEYGRGADVGGLGFDINNVLIGKSVEEIKTQMQSTNDWKIAHPNGVPDTTSPSQVIDLADSGQRGDAQWATVTMQNQLTAITNGSTSHIGTASLYAGINNQINANVNPNNTNNSQLQTGAQQSGYSSNTQDFQSSNWVMVTGDPATHLAAGNSFGSITAPNGGQIASLNNANLPYTLVTKDFYVPVGVRQVTLTFNGNFVTNEYPVYVGSIYNDNATVKITSPSGNVTPVTAFNQTLNSGNFATVNGLPAPLDTMGGQTGFKASSATIAVAGGGVVTVQVKVANVGDTAFPSAVLLNNITVK